jgi:hypothetical protein
MVNQVVSALLVLTEFAEWTGIDGLILACEGDRFATLLTDISALSGLVAACD